MNEVGVVIIGRNEGERLKRCIQSTEDYPQVYVDSGSTDESVIWSKTRNVPIVELDMAKPFTAARARNEGAAKLLELHPELQFLQFVDGDCEIESEWIPSAITFLKENPEATVACGRRKERFPEKSVYNLICDMEWDTSCGESQSCGGDAIYRVETFNKVKGFDPAFIAGEEPELCYRLRSLGGKIHRLDIPMTKHDAAMYHFKQWWKRTLRSGYAYMLNYIKHGKIRPERFIFKELRSIFFWLTVLIILVISNVIIFNFWFLLLSASGVAAQIVRAAISDKRRLHKYGLGACLIYSSSNFFSKVPQGIGAIQCWYKKLRGRQLYLVEYK